MATLAELLISSGFESAQKAPDISGAITQGAQLAQTIEGMKQSRALMEQKKQELQMQKANSITDTIKIAAEAKDPKLKNFMLKNVVPGKVKALGMDEFFTPQTLEMLQTSDAVMQKVLGLKLDLDQKVRSGEITGAQAYKTAQSILSDPEELALLDTDQIFEAQKFSASEEGKSYRAKLVADEAAGRAGAARDDAGNVEYDKQVARSFGDYQLEGGSATVGFNYNKLTESLSDLDSGSVPTGKGLVRIIGGSDFAVDLTNPKVAAARDGIRSAIVGTLRPILGGAFAEKEGQRILDLSFNPRLSASENAKRVRAEVERIKIIVRNKEDEFIKAGRLAPDKRTVFGKKKTKSPPEGETQEWDGKKYKKIKGGWEEVE